ncbi:MAG: putative lipid II flippase MurJ [Chlamydiae bacterium]|nr:putative lipid II flippase MurJ [Chlamydiota bacterium]
MKNVDTPQFVSRSALRFFSGTALSKISGMLRDIAMAFYFGTSLSLAAFLLSFRFVYLARRLFGESLLHQGFIPHFEEKRAHDPRRAALFFRDLFWSMVVFLAGLVFIGEIVLSLFGGEAFRLARFMLPGVFFICLFGFCTGLLQSEKSFFVPSVAPVSSNIVWILGIILFKNLPTSQAVSCVAITLSFAFFLQWAMTIPKMWAFLKAHLSFREMMRGSLFSHEIRILLRPLMLGMIGVASVQINSALDGIFGHFASPGGPAYLWYAIRIQQLPLALFGIALSSALLPSLSRAVERREMTQFFSLIAFARKRAFALIFPCVIGILVLGLASVNLLFGRGDFSHDATGQTTLCLWSYGLGLLPMVLVQIYAPAFYAKKDYKTPMLGFVYSTGINITLNVLFVFYFKMGAASIALATSIAAIYNFFYLSQKLKRPKESWSSSLRVAICCFFSGVIVMAFGYFALGDLSIQLDHANLLFPREFTQQALHFFSQMALYFVLFFSLCKLFQVRDILDLYSSRVAQRKSTS